MENPQTHYREGSDRGDNTRTSPKPMTRRKSLSLTKIVEGSRETKWRSNASDTEALLWQQSKTSIEAVRSLEHENDAQKMQRIQKWQESAASGDSADHFMASQTPESSDTQQRNNRYDDDLNNALDEMRKADESFDPASHQNKRKTAYEVLRIRDILDKKLDYIVENNMMHSLEAEKLARDSRELRELTRQMLENEDFQRVVPTRILNELKKI